MFPAWSVKYIVTLFSELLLKTQQALVVPGLEEFVHQRGGGGEAHPIAFLTGRECTAPGSLDTCEQAATLVTSNLPFNEWTEIFGSERLTGALLDRLTHHVHILELNGESYRLEHSKKARPPAAAPVP